MLYATARRVRRRLQVLLGAYHPPETYQGQFVERVGRYCDIRGDKVLVVGANTGEDCRPFIESGAAEVHGLDVIEDVGKNFQHKRVKYHRSGIECTALPENFFDIVFSVATMEHVQDIESGFREMVRLAKPGGYIFSSASPLWQSPQGHHMGCFDEHPWVHLVFARDDLIAYARSSHIHGERGLSIESIVDYMLNPDFFNTKPANEYIDACTALESVVLMQNDLQLEPETLLQHPLGARAMEMGYRKESLLAVTHTLIARKGR